MDLRYLSFLIFVVAVGGGEGCSTTCEEGYVCVVTAGKAACEESALARQMCEGYVCANGGKCQVVETIVMHKSVVIENTCVCDAGFVGDNCTFECPVCGEKEKCALVNESAICRPKPAGKLDSGEEKTQNCTEHPCKNGGTCVNETICTCTDGYKGDMCEQEVCDLECEESMECKISNGSAVCRLIIDGKIAPGTDGEDENVEDCTKYPCQNDGKCVNTTSCVCGNNHTGDKCEVACDPECQGEAICKMRNGTATCMAKMSRQTLVDESVCDPNPCSGDCTCEPSCKHELGYYCVSQEGFIGKNCDIAIPRVTCSETSIDVEVSNAFYEEFDKNIGNSVIYVSPSPDDMTCIALESGFNSYQFTIPLPFDDCMTKIDTNNVAAGGISFKNKLWINRQTGGSFDMPVPIVNFTCIYAREYTATMSLQPMIEENVAIVSRSGHYAVDMSLCKQQICQSSCPSYLQVRDSAVYTIGQMIHFNVMVTTQQSLVNPQPKFVTTLERIFLSCSADRFDNGQILATMAAAGCPQPNQQFSFMMTSGISSTPESVCGSIQVPRAAGCDKIFIHAEVLLCMAADLQPCLNDNSNNFCINGARKRRSLEKDDDDDTAYLVMGPITVISGSKGRKIENLFLDGTKDGVVTFADDDVMMELPVKPMEDGQMTTPADITYYFPIILIIGIVSFTISCVTLVAFILSRLYRSRVELRTGKAVELLPPTA